MSQLHDLPDELIKEILFILKREDYRDFINVASTCKRFERIAAEVVLYPQRHNQSRRSKIDLNGLVLLRVEANKNQPREELDETRNFISRAIESKHRVYEGLLIEGHELESANFLPLNQDESSKIKISALTTLHLKCCSVTLPWIHNIMIQLTGLKNVILERVAYTEIEMGRALIQSRPERVLDRIAILDDENYDATDVILKYFLDHWPTSMLDITGSKVQRNTLVIKRFYRGYHGHLEHFNESKPSKFLLTYPMIYKYLKRHRNTVKFLIIDYLQLHAEDVKVILVDGDLQNLQIVLKKLKNEGSALDYNRITMLRQLASHDMRYRGRIMEE